MKKGGAMSEDEVELKNLYINMNVWERLEKYWKEDLNYHGEIEDIIQQAIKEYLDKKEGKWMG